MSTAPLILPTPDLAHGALYLLWFVALDNVVSEGRDYLNHGRAS